MDAVITCFEAIENELKPSRQDEMNSLLLVQAHVLLDFSGSARKCGSRSVYELGWIWLMDIIT